MIIIESSIMGRFLPPSIPFGHNGSDSVVFVHLTKRARELSDSFFFLRPFSGQSFLRIFTLVATIRVSFLPTMHVIALFQRAFSPGGFVSIPVVSAPTGQHQEEGEEDGVFFAHAWQKSLAGTLFARCVRRVEIPSARLEG